MMLIAFPGQGSQQIGMCKDLYDALPDIGKIFEEADDVLGFSLKKLMFYGTQEELRTTKNAQPALLTSCMATLKFLEIKFEKKLHEFADFLAGHSMGQYTALCASNSISFKDTLSLLDVRAKLMNQAPPGRMLACLNTPLEDVLTVLEKAQKHGICCIANYNSDSQTILSGSAEAISVAESELKMLKYKSVMLNVSGAFHSLLMQEAAIGFKEWVDKVKFNPPQINIIDNVTGLPLGLGSVKETLVNHLTNPVKWVQTINNFLKLHEQVNNLSQDADKVQTKTPTMVEIGPGSVLTNLAKRDNKPIKLVNISNVEDVQSFVVSNRLII
jgi:[acyl-carrier-protein] S-malonyltransferase